VRDRDLPVGEVIKEWAIRAAVIIGGWSNPCFIDNQKKSNY